MEEEGFIILAVVLGIIICVPLIILAIVLSMFFAAYTIALLHIVFVEPVIFETYSIFTLPYNRVWDIANKYPLYYWIVVVIYLVEACLKTKKCKCD